MLEKYSALQLQLYFSSYLKKKAPKKRKQGEALSDWIWVDQTCFDIQKKVEEGSYQVVYIYHMAEGKPFLALKNWLEAKACRHLIFLEDALEEIHAAAVNLDTNELFSHPRVHVHFLEKQMDDCLEELANKFPCEQMAVFSMHKETARFKKIQLELMRKTVLWHAVFSEALSGHKLYKNIIHNLQKMPQSFDVNQTGGVFADIPIVICGAGPSLEQDIPVLQKLQDKVIIIGCGSALSVLSHFHIKPHFGIAVDPNPKELTCLEGCHYRDIPLIYGNRLYPVVFQLFDGPYGHLRTPAVSYLEKKIEEELGLPQDEFGQDLGREALSVTTLAVALACFWKSPIIALTGVDLSYHNRRRYSEGATAHDVMGEEVLVKRKSAYGKFVTTHIKWIMERQTLDAYTKLYPGIQFIHTAQAGLGFNTISYQPLTSLIQQAPQKDLKKKIAQIIQNHPCKANLADIQTVLLSVQESLTRCEKLVKGLTEEKEGSGKAVLYEQELYDEKAYDYLLFSALEAALHVYSIQDQEEVAQGKWTLLKQIIEDYQALFQDLAITPPTAGFLL